MKSKAPISGNCACMNFMPIEPPFFKKKKNYTVLKGMKPCIQSILVFNGYKKASFIYTGGKEINGSNHFPSVFQHFQLHMCSSILPI